MARQGPIDIFGQWRIIRRGRICDSGRLILNKPLPTLILASASPRRQQLLSLLGMPFTVAASDVDEALPPDTSPAVIVRDLALAKAQTIAAIRPHCLIIAADTVVALDDRILGKPRDAEEAVAMLLALRGRWHRVWTGLAVMRAHPEPPLVVTVATDVLMRDYSSAEIAAYVATGDPLDKAAAYAIQHADFHPVARIAGCHANVMGLPLCHLYALLVQVNATPPILAATACPAHLGIVCPPCPDD
jgi:septum formation protein